jgi:thiol-disulfide isomerase/thioredoxin
MKKMLWAVCCALLFIAGCKENDPAIVYHVANSTDTTYIVSTPVSAPHNVLVEEFTGQTCPNCPAAHATLDAAVAANPGRVNVIGLYIYGIPQGTPVPGSANDLRDSSAYAVASQIYKGVGSLPVGGVDRIYQSGSPQLDASLFTGVIGSQLSVADSVNLSVSSSYNATTNQATITVTTTYIYASPSNYYLSLVLVEDSIIDKQEYPEFSGYPGNIDTAYVFSNVFRGMATASPAGDPVLSSMSGDIKESGRTEQRIYIYTLPVKSPAIKPAHCRIIAYVTGGPGNSYAPVLQSQQCPLQ